MKPLNEVYFGGFFPYLRGVTAMRWLPFAHFIPLPSSNKTFHNVPKPKSVLRIAHTSIFKSDYSKKKGIYSLQFTEIIRKKVTFGTDYFCVDRVMH